MVQGYEEKLERLREEMRKMREADNERIRDLEEENQALGQAAQALAALNAPQVCVRHLLFEIGSAFVLLLFMIAPGLESHQYLAGLWKRLAQLPCWPPGGRQVSHQR